ncbi:carboxylesterase family domain-containing protein [Phthorimaea operculella]|nr:carboxylesterase family domain-containing protein [Phthorimaea operculella]
MLLYFIGVISLALNAASVRVEVEQGVLEGKRVELVTKDGFYNSFKGIPYAAPPLGKLRFKAPEPPLRWEGVRNASEHGPICIQNNIFERTQYENASREDCLFLNVYTPDLEPKTPLPVMFFIFGGAFESGSGNDDIYGPDFLLPHGVILVTINYRLEALGFLSLENEDVPGNAGMKDQVAALKWVKKNIAKFGGDPDNITVFGQSSGSASVVYHMASPRSRDLFKRAILMSGVPNGDWSSAYQSRRRAFILGQQLGFDTQDPKKLLEFLQNVPAEKLADVSPNVLASEDIAAKVFKIYHFTPTVEKDFGQERFLTEDPGKYLIKNGVKQDAVMMGHTSAESMLEMAGSDDIFTPYSQKPELLVPRQIIINNVPDKVLEISDLIRKHYFGDKAISIDTAEGLLNLMGDVAYSYDIHKYVRIFSASGKTNVFEYKFSAVSDRNLYRRAGVAKFNFTGVSHFDDTAYVFNPNYAKLPIDKNSREYKLIQMITKLYTNVAKFGNPTPDSSTTVWPPFNKSSESYVDISDTLTVGEGLDNDAAAFWKDIYKKANTEM